MLVDEMIERKHRWISTYNWIHILALAAGMYLLTRAFGWEIGIGVSCLVWYHKTPVFV